jgi:CheY-like chemotaxis protein
MQSILVVDDEPNVRKLVAVNLLCRGYQVFEAKDGSQALAQLRDHDLSLMVLDIKLPDINGWEILNEMKQNPLLNGTFPVLVMTASLMEAQADTESFPRVVEVLMKPFSTDRLVAAVERALRTNPKG